MKLRVHSYRFAREILEHEFYRPAWREIISVCEGLPAFKWAGKSKKVKKADIVQQLANTYFDRRFSVDCGWVYHPLATAIKKSGLAADYRKSFGDLTIQAEVQFGNMARWYSDVFKFQTAYSQSRIQMGLTIVPVSSLAKRIDQNIVSFERVIRELPSAELSITLPILVIGLECDDTVEEVDLT